jgi:hypothetical protein
MENRLINYFSRFTALTESEIQALTESMVIKEIKKGSFFSKRRAKEQGYIFCSFRFG